MRLTESSVEVRALKSAVRKVLHGGALDPHASGSQHDIMFCHHDCLSDSLCGFWNLEYGVAMKQYWFFVVTELESEGPSAFVNPAVPMVVLISHLSLVASIPNLPVIGLPTCPSGSWCLATRALTCYLTRYPLGPCW